MKNKQLLTYGLIALGIFFLTRKKSDQDVDISDNSDTVLPGSSTPTAPVKPTPTDPVVANPTPADTVTPKVNIPGQQL